MQRVIDWVLNPVLFGVAAVAALAAVHYLRPDYTGVEVAVLVGWGIAIGLYFAFGDRHDDNGQGGNPP
jgi:hypothetical protein